VSSLAIDPQRVATIDVPSPTPDLGELNDWVVTTNGTVMMARTEPGRVFEGTLTESAIRWSREVGSTKHIDDMAWHDAVGLVLLDSLDRKIVVIPTGAERTSFPSAHFERDLCVSPTGTIVSTTLSEGLLSQLDKSGRVLNSFGKRLEYDNQDLDFALNAGHLACFGDRVYIAFVHPAIVRAYTLDGSLIWESPMHPGHEALTPEITRAKTPSGFLSIRSSYSVASLGIGVDRHGRVYVLKSGLEAVAALTRGSDTVEVFAPNGESLGDIVLPYRARKIQVVDDTMYTLSKDPFAFRRIDLAGLQLPGS
jgi:hypothetical protein